MKFNLNLILALTALSLFRLSHSRVVAAAAAEDDVLICTTAQQQCSLPIQQWWWAKESGRWNTVAADAAQEGLLLRGC